MAKSPLTLMKEEQAVERRRRLKIALIRTGTTSKDASLRAGLSETYVHDFISGKSPSADQPLRAICDAVGIRWEWLDSQIPESDPMLKSRVVNLPSAIETTRLLLESVLGYFAPTRPQSELHDCAELLLNILLEAAQNPNFSELKNDERQRDRIRGIIEGALRATLRP